MPYEMMVSQGRMWEIKNRGLNGYCEVAYSIFWRSKENRTVEIEAGKNICYCIKDPSEDINNNLLRYLRKFIHLMYLCVRILFICRKNKIDAIVSNSNALRELELACLLTRNILSIPFLAYIGRQPTGYELDKYSSIEEIDLNNKNYKIALERYILNAADKVIVRPSFEDLFAKLFMIDLNKLVSISHKTRFDYYLKKSTELNHNLANWLRGNKIIMTYCRLGPEKYVDFMIKGFKLVKMNRDNVVFLVIGDGPEKQNLITLVNELGLENCVRFENFMSQEKIAAITNYCDIIIQFGGKGMFESALAGKPLITYDFDMTGLFGLIDHMETALRAKTGDKESLAECIELYLGNPEFGKKLGSKLQKRAREHNNWAKIDKKLANAIEEAIANKLPIGK